MMCPASAGASCGAVVLRDLVPARIIVPVSKLDSLRVLEEAGVAPAGAWRSSGACRPTRRRHRGGSCPRRVRSHGPGTGSLVL